jgi:hypothetical protein
VKIGFGPKNASLDALATVETAYDKEMGTNLMGSVSSTTVHLVNLSLPTAPLQAWILQSVRMLAREWVGLKVLSNEKRGELKVV